MYKHLPNVEFSYQFPESQEFNNDFTSNKINADKKLSNNSKRDYKVFVPFPFLYIGSILHQAAIVPQ